MDPGCGFSVITSNKEIYVKSRNITLMILSHCSLSIFTRSENFLASPPGRSVSNPQISGSICKEQDHGPDPVEYWSPSSLPRFRQGLVLESQDFHAQHWKSSWRKKQTVTTNWLSDYKMRPLQKFHKIGLLIVGSKPMRKQIVCINV